MLFLDEPTLGLDIESVNEIVSFLQNTNYIKNKSIIITSHNIKFIENVVDKRMNMGIKTPEWLELQKQHRKGIVLRLPERVDITVPIEEHLIVELYSK